MNEYVVVCNLDTEPKQEYALNDEPLHLTLLDTFYSQNTAELFDKKLARTARNTESFSVVGERKALFGLNHDIPVTTVKKAKALVTLHQNLLKAFSSSVNFMSPQHIGPGYSPHVTDQPIRKLAVGKSVIIDNLTLIRVGKSRIHVEGTHKLD